MAALDRVRLWESIASASDISNSITSRNLRTMAKAFKASMEFTHQSMDPPREVEVRQLIERDSGKLVTKLG